MGINYVRWRAVASSPPHCIQLFHRQCLAVRSLPTKGESRWERTACAALHGYEDFVSHLDTLQLYHALQIFQERLSLLCQNLLSTLRFFKG
jgi:hypothetical protein